MEYINTTLIAISFSYEEVSFMLQQKGAHIQWCNVVLFIFTNYELKYWLKCGLTKRILMAAEYKRASLEYTITNDHID